MTMKRILIIIGAGALLIACNKENAEQNSAPLLVQNDKSKISVTAGVKEVKCASALLCGYANPTAEMIGDIKVGFAFSTSAESLDGLKPLNQYYESNGYRNNGGYGGLNYYGQQLVTVSGIESDGFYKVRLIHNIIKPNTKYFFRSFVFYGGVYRLGEVLSFKTASRLTDGAVDMGLSVKWRSCNLGASKPEDYGDYYAWGAIQPYYLKGHAQDNPCESWTKWKTGYNSESYTVEQYDDAARLTLNNKWRTPTRDESIELMRGSIERDMEINGVNGELFTSPISGESIFFPDTGYREGLEIYHSKSISNQYWTSTDVGTAAGVVAYVLSHDNKTSSCFLGRPIRPVTD